MENDLEGVDLEELEARLYSQVYHCTSDDSFTCPEISQDTITENVRNFQENNSQNLHNVIQNKNPYPSIFLEQSNIENGMVYNEFSFNNQGRGKVLPNRVRKKVLPNFPRTREALLQLEARQNRRKEQRQRRKERKRLNKIKTPIDYTRDLEAYSLYRKIKEANQVIILTDSEEDGCIEIPANVPLVYISDSDECKDNIESVCEISENNHLGHQADSKGLNITDLENLKSEDTKLYLDNSDDDDVIIVPPKENEVVCIDTETESLIEPETPLGLQQIEEKNVEEPQGEVSQLDDFQNITPQDHYSPKDRTQMSSTPESNDFLENSVVEVNQSKLNFSLQSSDFDHSEFLRPANPGEIYETESSCSTSDFNPPLKPVVFNQVEFPKEDNMFSETNLENHDLGETAQKNTGSNLKPQEHKLQTSKPSTSQADVSDSSSESDYEEVASNKAFSKKLPDLSCMNEVKITEQSKCDANAQTKQGSRKRSTEEEHSLGPNKAKKKKKLNSTTPIENKSNANAVVVTKQIESDSVDQINIIADENEEITDVQNPNFEANSYPDSLMTVDEADISFDESSLELNTLEHVGEKSNSLGESSLPSKREKKTRKLRSFTNTWSPNKKEFYSSTYEAESFNLDDILSKMSSDPKLWQISSYDRYPSKTPFRRRCQYCREVGHMASYCPNKSVICNICAEHNHLANACPYKYCKECGKDLHHLPNGVKRCRKCTYFRHRICNLCRSVGHSHNICPDMWRRYYLTTTSGPLKTPEEIHIKPRAQLWCSNCATSGHLDHECQRSSSPKAVMHIESYEDVYLQSENEKGGRNSGINRASFETRATFQGHEQFNDRTQRVEERYQNANFDRYKPSTSYQTTSYSQSQLMGGCLFNQLTTYTQNSNQYICSGLVSAPSSTGISNVISTQQNVVVQALYNDHRSSVQDQTLPAPNVGAIFEKSRLYKLINYSPVHVVQGFLKNELIKLEYLKCDPVCLKKKISEFESSKDSYGRADLKKCYKELNMLVFGIHLYKKGDEHLKTLHAVQNNLQTCNKSRKDIWKAYNYIFGVAKHDSESLKLLQTIINEGHR